MNCLGWKLPDSLVRIATVIEKEENTTNPHGDASPREQEPSALQLTNCAYGSLCRSNYATPRGIEKLRLAVGSCLFLETPIGTSKAV